MAQPVARRQTLPRATYSATERDWLSAPSRCRRRRPLPLADIQLILLCSIVLPFSLYLAVALISPLTVGHLLVVVATAYALTSVLALGEALWAFPRRRALIAERTTRRSHPPYFPSVTALVVAYLPNEQHIIIDTVRHLLERLDVPRDRLQVILAYNSPEALPVERDIAALAAADVRLTVVKASRSTTKAENVNAALPYVRGTITGLFDSDHRPEPACFRKADRWLAAGYDVVQGRCVIRNRDENWLTRIIGVEFETMYSVAHASRSLSVDTAIFGGSNGYWRTSVLRALRMDPSKLTEDIDITVRALLRGRRILHDRSIISTELAPSDIGSWFYQRLRWAQGWHQVTLAWSRGILGSAALSWKQKVYWGAILPWRELFAVISPQAFPILLALVSVQLRFGGSWRWHPYLTATTVLTFLSCAAAALVAHRHQTLLTRDARRLDTLIFVVLSPFLTFVANTITFVAWARECRREREWIPTPRGDLSLVTSSAAPPSAGALDASTPSGVSLSPGCRPTAREDDTRFTETQDRREHRTPLLPTRHARCCGAAVVVVTLLGLFLRLRGLSSQSLWVDEGLSVWIARKNVADMVTWLVQGDTHPPLYVGLLHVWMKLGDSVTWIRLLSVTASVATIPFLYLLGRRLFGSHAALLSAFLLAVSPFSIKWAQNARPYALLCLFAIVASYCLVWGLESRQRAPWLLYMPAALAALFTHNVGGAIIVAAHVALLLGLSLAKQQRAKVGLRAVSVTLGIWLIWLPAIVVQTLRGGSYWLDNPTPRDLEQLALTFMSSGLPAESTALSLGSVLVAAALSLICLGVFSLWKNKSSMLVAVVLLFGPLVLELDLSVLQPVFLDRTMISLIPVFILVLSGGLMWLARRTPGRILAMMAVGTLLLLNFQSLEQYYDLEDGQDVNERWDEAAEHVAQRQRPDGDVILFQANTSQLPFGYYYKQLASPSLPYVGVPCTLDFCNHPEGQTSRAARERMERELRPYRRIWLVKRWWGNWDFSIGAAIGQGAAERLRRVDVQAFPGVAIELYEAAVTSRTASGGDGGGPPVPDDGGREGGDGR